jgi:hypothetical protein
MLSGQEHLGQTKKVHVMGDSKSGIIATRLAAPGATFLLFFRLHLDAQASS